MPGMPYHLEKGPWLTLLEDYLNASPDRARRALEALKAGVPLTEFDFLDSPSFDGDPEYGDLEARLRHLALDWFGRAVDGVQPTFRDATAALLPDGKAREGFAKMLDAAAPSDGDPREEIHLIAGAAMRHGLSRGFPGTGFWHSYYGDVEGIVRLTLQTAIEVSFGVGRGKPVPEDLDARLPIELFWKCPQRWFEGWVTWRFDGATGAGQVTVVMATPGSGKPLLERPLSGKGAVEPDGPGTGGPGPAPVSPIGSPDHPIDAKGMWVVSHADHVLLPPLPVSRAGRRGQWVIPAFGPAYAGVGPLQVVAPSEADGGVRGSGRPFEPAVPSTPKPSEAQ